MSPKGITFYRSLSTAFEDFVERKIEWIMLWPLFVYALIIYIEPKMFETYPHYIYLREALEPIGWEITFLSIVALRSVALFGKAFWDWPLYAPFSLAASIGGALLWSQFTISFFISYYFNNTTPGPLAAHSTLVLIEMINVVYSARAVGQMIQRGMVDG